VANHLISNGANVNVTNGVGATPLIYAATFNKPDIVELLLTNTADKTAKDSQNKTALDHAKSNGFDAIVKLLE